MFLSPGVVLVSPVVVVDINVIDTGSFVEGGTVVVTAEAVV